MRLKSPITAIGPNRGAIVAERESRNWTLDAWSQGPYTLTMEKRRLSRRNEKVVVREKSPIEWSRSSRMRSSQAVMMPPEAPDDGLKTKLRSEGGRKDAARKVEIESSFDSCRQRIEGRKESRAACTSSRLRRWPRPRTFQEAINSLINIVT